MIIKHLSRLGLFGGATAVALGVLAAQALAQGAGNAPGKTIVPPAGAAGAAAPGKTATPVPGPAGAAGAAAPGKTTTPSTGAATPPSPNAAGAGTAAASTDAVWRKICGPTPTGKQACAMIYEIRTAQGQLVSQVSIQKVDGETKYGLRVVLPVGVFLPPGVTLQIDGKGKTEAKFTACAAQPAVCVAEGSFEAVTFDAMRKGTKIIMAAKSGQQKDMSFDISLASFGKVFDGPAETPTK